MLKLFIAERNNMRWADVNFRSKLTHFCPSSSIAASCLRRRECRELVQGAAIVLSLGLGKAACHLEHRLRPLLLVVLGDLAEDLLV